MQPSRRFLQDKIPRVVQDQYQGAMITKKKQILCLHVGMDKTGSTALQTFFRNNASILDSLNIHYINHGRGDRLNHHALCQNWLEDDYSDLIAIRAELQENPASSGLISFEGLYHLDEDRLKEIHSRLSNFQVKVVIYLRRQSDMVRSGVAQRIKQGTNHLPLSEYTADRLAALGQDYQPVLDRFRKVFGRGKVMVRRYERSSWPEGSIFLDFLQAMGLPMTQAQFDQRFTLFPRDMNPTLDVDAIHLLDTFDRLGIDPERRRQVVDILSCNASGDRSTFVSGDLARAIDEQFEQSNRRIAMEWFGEPHLFSEPSGFVFRQAAEKRVGDYFSLVRRWLPFYEMPVWKGEGLDVRKLIQKNRLAAIEGWKGQGTGNLKLGPRVGSLACRVRGASRSDLVFHFSGHWLDAQGLLEVSVNGEMLYQGDSPSFSVRVPNWLYDRTHPVVVFRFNAKGRINWDHNTGSRIVPVLLIDSVSYEKFSSDAAPVSDGRVSGHQS